MKFNNRKVRVVSHRQLSPTGYLLSLERDDFEFHAGQTVLLHGSRDHEERSYTVSSGEQDNTIDILYRLIPEGVLTPQLASLKPGDGIDMSGPCGEFVLRDPFTPAVFIATGTGIAPCRSFLRTHPKLNMTILHGVRTGDDLFFRDEFSGIPYVPCVTGSIGPWHQGRVTGALVELSFPGHAHFYLCGANEMIYETREQLEFKGVPAAHIFSEPYYYRQDG